MTRLNNDTNDFYTVVASLLLCSMIAFVKSEDSCLSIWARAIQYEGVSDEMLYSTLSEQCKPDPLVTPFRKFNYNYNSYIQIMMNLKNSLELVIPNMSGILDFETIKERDRMRYVDVAFVGSDGLVVWERTNGQAIGKIFKKGNARFPLTVIVAKEIPNEPHVYLLCGTVPPPPGSPHDAPESSTLSSTSRSGILPFKPDSNYVTVFSIATGTAPFLPTFIFS